MAGGVIRETSPTRCWTAFTDQVWGYWGRLQEAGSGRGVIAVTPTFGSIRRALKER